MQSHEVLHEGETQPGAFVPTIEPAVDLMEGSVTLSSASGGMPMPVSVTDRASAPSGRSLVETVTLPPAG